METEDFNIEKKMLLDELQRRLKNANKKLRSLESALLQCQKWPELHHEGILLQANLYMWDEKALTLIVEDWENENQKKEIILSAPFNRQNEIARRIHQSKRQQTALPRLKIEIAKATTFRNQLLEQIETLSSILEISPLIAFRKNFISSETKQVSKKTEKSLPYREFLSQSGLRIWVGKKAKDNETLTFTLAHGLDFWLHVHGYAGSHVIIKAEKGNNPDEQTLQDALQLAIYYSKAKSLQWADVVITQRKHVSRFGKGPKNCGKVQISTHKLISVKVDPQRLEILRQHQARS